MKKRAAKPEKKKKDDDRADRILVRTVKQLENTPGRQPNKYLFAAAACLVIALGCMIPTPFIPMREWYFNSIGPARTSVGFLYFDIATPFLDMVARMFSFLGNAAINGYKGRGPQVGQGETVVNGQIVQSNQPQDGLIWFLGQVTGTHSLRTGMTKFCSADQTISALAAWGSSCSTLKKNFPKKIFG
jgi:hypothetical protein